ncbi:MAG: DUF4296 domain-containing protein [Bacteroidales bacterium]|nr:DUF4296 domain-containing protein [Bacteroidales bacterium]
MKKLFAFLFFLAILASCQDDLTKINSSKTIPREKFVNILVEMHLMDVITGNPRYSRKFDASDSLDIYGSIFEKYNVSKALFDTTVAMYVRQPDVYLKVYDEVLLKLNYMQDTLRDNIPKFTNEAIER